MITILRRGGMPKWLQYYIGGEGSLGTPKSDYVICARPLMGNTILGNPIRGIKIREERLGQLERKSAHLRVEPCSSSVPQRNMLHMQLGRPEQWQSYLLFFTKKIITEVWYVSLLPCVLASSLFPVDQDKLWIDLIHAELGKVKSKCCHRHTISMIFERVRVCATL